MDISKKLREISQQEEEQREKQKQLYNIAQQICSLKKSIDNNDILGVTYEQQRDTLIKQCRDLELEVRLQKLKIDDFREKAICSTKTCQAEKTTLDEIHMNVWSQLEEFIKDSKLYLDVNANCEKVNQETIAEGNSEIEQDILYLNGQIHALNIYLKFQEKRILTFKDYIRKLQDN